MYPVAHQDSDLPIADGITLSEPPPPTHPYAGNNSARQSVGLPGHCEACAQHGHVAAHPDFGCGDVGCTTAHLDAPAQPVSEVERLRSQVAHVRQLADRLTTQAAANTASPVLGDQAVGRQQRLVADTILEALNEGDRNHARA